MTCLLLIRHATTDAVGHVLVGRQPGVALNARGREQATELGKRLATLPLRAIVASPLERTVQTAEAIAATTGAPIRMAESLLEFDLGVFTGSTLAELEPREDWKRFNVFRSGTRAPGGESMQEVQLRITSEMERLAREYPDDVIALVSHGDVIRAALLFYLGVPLELFLRLEISPASVSSVRLEPWGARVLCVNHSGPQPPIG